MIKWLLKTGVLGSLFLAAGASAAPVVLDFEGLQDNEEILEFYNGGSGSLGSIGPDLDISFTNGALALIDSDAGGSGNFANEPSADTIAFFLSGSDLVMNVLGGFDTGFSFFYTSSGSAGVTVFDGFDGTGNVLGNLALGQNHTNNCSGDPTGGFCNWDPIGVAFAGTAFSVSFAGAANQVGFDNITLASDTPGVVPAPAAFALLLLGLAGLAGRTRRTA